MKISDLNIAILQQDIVWEQKTANFEHLEKIFLSIAEPIDLLILPETFDTGFSQNTKLFDEYTCQETFLWVKKMAQKLKTKIIASWYILENQKLYNRLHYVDENGLVAFYDKRHTFRLSAEADNVTCGLSHTYIDIKGWKISPFVCYDLRFPTWCRNHFNNNEFDYDIALFIANWPSTRTKAWNTLLQARAIENISYAIGVNRVGTDETGLSYSGDSVVISPNGNVVYQFETNTEELKIFTLNHSNLDNYRKKYPFYLDWD